MSERLVERLREAAEPKTYRKATRTARTPWDEQLMNEAADRIERLTAALEPFAKVADYAPTDVGNPEVVVVVHKDEGRWTIHLSLDDFRNARTTLSETDHAPQ